MISIEVSTSGLNGLERALADLCEKQMATATAKALTRTATGARKEVMGRFDAIFDRPTAFTKNSVRYMPATRDDLQARVFISDDAAKGLSPHKYLQAEIEGGNRRDKRSEKSMQALGIMRSGQQWVAGRGMTLDQFGNVAASTMVTVLSRVGGFREGGFRANATEKTRKRLIKQGVALSANGFDYFVKRRGRNGPPIGIYRVTSPGVKATPGVKGSSVRAQISPQLIFTANRASYKARFPFTEMVNDYASRNFGRELARAFQEEIARMK